MGSTAEGVGMQESLTAYLSLPIASVCVRMAIHVAIRTCGSGAVAWWGGDWGQRCREVHCNAIRTYLLLTTPSEGSPWAHGCTARGINWRYLLQWLRGRGRAPPPREFKLQTVLGLISSRNFFFRGKPCMFLGRYPN